MEQRAWSTELDAMRRLRCLLICLVLLTGCGGPRDLAVATVDGAAILESELSSELRAMLWRRGEAWGALDEAMRKSRRQEALDRCIEQRLLRGVAKEGANLPAAQAQASEDAYQQFLKQFEPPDGWKGRLDLQGVSEVQMRQRMTMEVAQGAAIEDWLTTHRTQSPEEMESAARAWFEQHREQLRLPDRAKISHIFLTGHDTAKPDRSAEIAELHRKLLAAEDTLESLAAKFSEDERSKRVGGSLGWIGRDRMPPDLAEQVFKLPLRKPGEPFRTKLGWHIVLVQERQAARLPEFAEVKDELMSRLDQEWRETAVKQFLQEMRTRAKIVVNEAVLQTLEPAPAGD